MAQEKSSRSLMFTLIEVFCSTAPVCSATFMNRLLNSSSSTGSGRPLPAGTRRGERLGAAQDHVVQRGDLGGPAGFDDGGGVGLAHQRRPGDAVAREQRRALEHRRLDLGAAGEHADAIDHFGCAGFAGGQRRLARRRCRAGGLGGNRLDHHRPLRRREAEPGAVRGGEVRQ